jgi:hypothetical protein
MTLSIRNSAAALTEKDVAAVEQALQIKFPDEYREFLLLHNGGAPRPSRFRMSEKAADAGMEWGEIVRFYSIGDGTDLEDTYRQAREWGLPKRLVPIAAVEDSLDGGMLCLSVAGKDCGRVYYHPELEAFDATIYGVAKSFGVLLQRLGRQGHELPAWVVAVQDGDIEALRQWLDGGGDLTEQYKTSFARRLRRRRAMGGWKWSSSSWSAARRSGSPTGTPSTPAESK